MQSSVRIRCRTKNRTPNICLMGFRKFFHELMVVSPFLLVGAITVQARTRVEEFVPAQYSSSMNRKVAAYSEPVRLVENALAKGVSHADPKELRMIAETWRNMSREGSLQPLSPETPEDTTREGIKGQIRKAVDDLSSALQYHARKQLKEGKAFAAALDAVLAVEAMQGFKYSDLYSVGMLSVRQNGAYHLIEEIVPKLNERERKQIAEKVLAVRQFEKPLTELVMAKQRVMMYADTGPNLRAANREHLDLMMKLATAVDGETPAAELETLSQELSQAALASAADSYLPEFRFAFNARRNSVRTWTQVHSALGVRPA